MNRSIIDTNKLLSLFKDVLSWWSEKQGCTTCFLPKLRVIVIGINIIYLIHSCDKGIKGQNSSPSHLKNSFGLLG